MDKISSPSSPFSRSTTAGLWTGCKFAIFNWLKVGEIAIRGYMGTILPCRITQPGLLTLV